MTKNSSNNIDCLWAVRSIDGALDGELSPSERSRFDCHVANCDSCASEFAVATSLKLILALGDNTVVLDEPLEESTSFVMSRIRLQGAPSRFSPAADNRRILIIGSLSLAASLMIFSVLMWYSARMMQRPDLASQPNRSTSLASPMLVATSVHDGNDQMNQMTAEEEALLAAGMMTLATPGVMSRIEAVASARSIPARKISDSATNSAQDSSRMDTNPR